MDLCLRDKVVWITGASGGIGRALADTFAAEGARLGLHAHRGTAELRAYVDQQPWADRALVLQADLRVAADLQHCADQLAERFDRIDVHVANAGVWPPGDQPLHELDVERLEDTLRVDLLGPLLSARAFLRRLRESGPRADGHGAALVFIGSTAGAFGEAGHVDYAAAKSGLRGAVATLKNEIVALDPYARVNLVQPGWTVTRMARPALDDDTQVARVLATMPLAQLGRAVDVARSVAWLASPTAARHVTGETITVAGGMEGRLLRPTDPAAPVDPTFIGAVRARLQQD